MRICFTYEGKTFCFIVPPIILRPWPPIGPDPGPEYGGLIADATILSTVHALANSLADTGVKQAIHAGLTHAVKAAQQRAGAHVTLSLQEQQG